MASIAQAKRTNRRFIFTGALALALLLAGFYLPTLLRGQSAWVEKCYNTGVYAAIKNAISSLTSLVPFSVAELVGCVLAIAAISQFVTTLILALLRIVAWRGLLRLLISYALAFGVLLNLFYATWGLQYFREPLASRMGLTVQARQTEELAAFVSRTAKQARGIRETLHEDENGVFAPCESACVMMNALPKAYETLGTRFPALSGRTTRAKGLLFSKAASYQGIAGIYIGLTAEPNVNVDQPPLLIMQGAAHEMAHQLGIASENEAEFVAYLACLCSDDPNVRYSALVYSLIVGGNALSKVDRERYLALTETYGDAIWRDIASYDAYWKAFDGALSEGADKRNDAYLKHNAQESGVASYGESVDLLLAYRAAYGWS